MNRIIRQTFNFNTISHCSLLAPQLFTTMSADPVSCLVATHIRPNIGAWYGPRHLYCDECIILLCEFRIPSVDYFIGLNIWLAWPGEHIGRGTHPSGQGSWLVKYLTRSINRENQQGRGHAVRLFVTTV